MQGVRQAAAGCDTSKQDAAIERIDAAAEDQGYREQQEMARALEGARQGVAAASTQVRIADRSGSRAAKDALSAAKKNLSRIEKEARRIGL
jgi:hypothetical protein